MEVLEHYCRFHSMGTLLSSIILPKVFISHRSKTLFDINLYIIILLLIPKRRHTKKFIEFHILWRPMFTRKFELVNIHLTWKFLFYVWQIHKLKFWSTYCKYSNARLWMHASTLIYFHFVFPNIVSYGFLV